LLHITPDIWIKRNNTSHPNLQEFTSLFSKDKYNFENLFQEGYEDAQSNKDYLDSIIGDNSLFSSQTSLHDVNSSVTS
jgi:hypothetical protein